MEITKAVAALAALAQDTRLAVYRTLVQAGPEGLAAGRIAETLSVPPATLSFHFTALANAGLVTSRQQGRFVIYSAHYDAMNELLGYLTEHCCAGSPGDCRDATGLPTTRCTPTKAIRRKRTTMSKRVAPRAGRSR